MNLHSSIFTVSGAVTEAGTDTTAGSIMWLTMALILFPETQKKAQEEIDEFFKESNVIPTFEHINHLPYCCAVVKEALRYAEKRKKKLSRSLRFFFRWNSSAPGGFPHLSLEDDEYNGYLVCAPWGLYVKFSTKLPLLD